MTTVTGDAMGRIAALVLVAMWLAGCSDNLYGQAPAESPDALKARLMALGLRPYAETPTDCRVPRLAATPATTEGLPRLSAAELAAIENCIAPVQAATYVRSGVPAAGTYPTWPKASTQAYRSEHDLFLAAWVNQAGAANYRAWEQAGPAPVGSRMAKASFTVTRDGRAAVGPLFFMEKMAKGFAPDGGDWRFTMVDGNGQLGGETGTSTASRIGYCLECHKQAARADYRLFVPEPWRAK